MAEVSRKPDGDRTMDFKGLLNNLQEWDSSLKEREKKLKSQDHDGGSEVDFLSMVKTSNVNAHQRKISSMDVGKQNYASSGVPTRYNEVYNRFSDSDAISRISSSLLNEESSPSATSEKDLGNEHFKKKDFHKAIECYSRSIALSPTSVAFANRAMAYLKIKRYEEAENDCTEALNLDDRYVKAYSRRATARKELGKLQASIEDSEFAMRLEPSNQELRKLHSETKALYEKEIVKQISGVPKNSPQGIQIVGDSEIGSEGHDKVGHSPTSDSHSATTSSEGNEKRHGIHSKFELKTSVQEVASRAAAAAAKNIRTPKTAYEFEVSWRALSDDSVLQAHLLKSIPPSTLPQLFKNALSASLLADIVKCITSFFKDETELSISILDNLAKVARFDLIVMALSPLDRADFHRIWDAVFSTQDVSVEQQAALGKLRAKFCPR